MNAPDGNTRCDIIALKTPKKIEPIKNEIAAEMNGEPTTFFMSALIGFWFANIKPAKSDKPRNTRTTILLLETYL